MEMYERALMGGEAHKIIMQIGGTDACGAAVPFKL